MYKKKIAQLIRSRYMQQVSAKRTMLQSQQQSYDTSDAYVMDDA